MSKWIAVLVVFGVAGCSEYDVVGEEPGAGPTPNPLTLEPEVQVDSFRQLAVSTVDVLWVIDDSCSMWDSQTSLAQNFSAFANHFFGTDLDYHIGVVSTDMSDPGRSGRLVQASGYRFIDPTTPDPVAIFGQMALLGTTGSWDEQGLAATEAAIDIQSNGYNAGFWREYGSLHVIVVSDEEDHSSGWDAPEFSGWMRGLPTNKTTFSSIVGPEDGCPGASEPGLQYLEVTRGIGGVEASICQDDWWGLLDELGMRAAEPEREFVLSRLPVPETIEVSVSVEDGATATFEPDVDWTYDPVRNSITFVDYEPVPMSEIVLTYQVLASTVDDDL